MKSITCLFIWLCAFAGFAASGCGRLGHKPHPFGERVNDAVGFPRESKIDIYFNSHDEKSIWQIAQGDRKHILHNGGGVIEIHEWREADVDGNGTRDEIMLYTAHYGSPIWHVAIAYDVDAASEFNLAVIEIGISGDDLVLPDNLRDVFPRASKRKKEEPLGSGLD